MSIHQSLAVKGKLVRTRNVFTRIERLEILTKSGRWKEGDSVYGLAKVRTRFKTKSRKAIKEAKAAESEESKSKE